MNCPNCGAPMLLLEERPGWRCDHCPTVVCPDSADAAGVQVLGEPPSSRLCPVCARPLLAAVMDDRHRIEVCAQCKGILIPQRVFATTVVAKRRASAGEGPAADAGEPRQLERQTRCPSCGGAMETDWYYGPGHVVIDRCGPCELIWLDAGELDRVVNAP